MPYIRVMVADSTFHGKEALTYESKDGLEPGRLVIVPLRDKQVLGIVVGVSGKPQFGVKTIVEAPDLPALPRPLVELLKWMPGYYPAPLGAIAQLFLPGNMLDANKKTDNAQPIPISPARLPSLTEGQKRALEQINNPGLHLLHGETGSGKTRVYIELAKKALEQGKSSLILTPEIGLTAQLAQNFSEVFGQNHVVTVHSRISPALRRKLWRSILESTTPIIVMGARSALFAPVVGLGLIVVDESHDNSYKQDSSPYYHTSVVAAKLAALHKAVLVLGSATPSVADYFISRSKGRPIVYMGETAQKSHPVSVAVVDRRDKRQFSKSAQLSDKLLAGIRQTLHNKEQSLVFLNRRGTARVVMCENCGWQALCRHCDLPLTYHADSHAVVCHSCGARGKTPTSCPECRNPSVLFKSVGTKAIVEQLARIFPNATIQRFDTDNAKAERLEAHYGDVRNGAVDILVGTQTLAKGLDLPGLGFVGVVDAETSLSFPDFSAAERSYQMLAQVLGRIGRGHRATSATIQSYDPNSPIIRAAITKNWGSFYNSEIEERKLFDFPPFCFILKVTCRRKSPKAAQDAAQKLCDWLRAKQLAVTIEGPAPCFHEKERGFFQWQIVVKSRSRSVLVDIATTLPAGATFDIDPVNLL
ncbi:MAG: replication restart helicase PriA [Candidatus Saccharimonadales bacterium]